MTENSYTDSYLYNMLFHAHNNKYQLIVDEIDSIVNNLGELTNNPFDYESQLGEHSKPGLGFSRLVDDDGKHASVVITYDGPLLVSFVYQHKVFINDSPLDFSKNVLQLLAKAYNVGDGNHRGDVSLSIEDSNVQNPADSSNTHSQFQLAFNITLQDIKSDTDKESDKDDGDNSDNK